MKVTTAKNVEDTVTMAIDFFISLSDNQDFKIIVMKLQTTISTAVTIMQRYL